MEKLKWRITELSGEEGGFNKFLSTFIYVLVLRFLLDFSYFEFLSPHYSNIGYEIKLNLLKAIESYLFLTLTYLTLPFSRQKVSSLVLQLFFLLSYVPTTSYYAWSDDSRIWMLLVTGFWIFVNLLYSSSLVLGVPKVRRNHSSRLIVFCGSMVFLSAAMIFAFMGFKLNLDLTKVYEIREEYNSAGIPLSGYLINWTGKFILPFLIVVSLFGRNRKVSIFSFLLFCFLAVLIFSSTGHKSYLFRIFMALGVVFLLQQRLLFRKLCTILSFVIIVSLLIYEFSGDLLAGALFIDRVFYTPAKLSFYYFDFFQNNFIYLSHSIFEGFVNYPFDESPPKIIARKYMNRPDGYSNNGMVADGYMNFGIPGLALWGFIFVLILKLADAVSARKNKNVIWALLLVSFKTLINGPLLTTLLSHGLILTLILAYVYPANREKEFAINGR